MPAAGRAAGAQAPVAAGARQRAHPAAGALYAVGQHNFLFDRCQQPHLTSDQLAAQLGVVKTTMANKAALIAKTLNLGAFEADLTGSATLEQHPLACLSRSRASSSTPACCQPTCRTRLGAAA